MAFYKQPCRYCQAYIPEDADFCEQCGHINPFADLCPNCSKTIRRESKFCSGCGQAVYFLCPHCGQRTFMSDSCDNCGKSLLKPCSNPRCGQLQFINNIKCTACGKKI